MGTCLALPVMHSYGYIDATHRYYKAEGIDRVGLDFPARVCYRAAGWKTFPGTANEQV